jgi:hypothetical protein
MAKTDPKQCFRIPFLSATSVSWFTPRQKLHDEGLNRETAEKTLFSAPLRPVPSMSFHMIGYPVTPITLIARRPFSIFI